MISKIISKKLAFFSNYYLSSINSMMSISSYRVFISQPIPNETIKILQDSNKIDFIINDQLTLSRNKLLESVKDCDGIFCTLNDKIDKEVLDHAGNKLKVIATCSVGYEHIDLKECQNRNIKVGYTPGVLTDATAELTVGLLLNTSRRINEAIEAAKNGEWGQWKILWMVGQGISGSTIGIFGLGRIGMAVAKRLQSFNPKQIIYHNRNANNEAEKSNLKYVDLDTLLKESDFLICTCASTNETANKFNLKLFEQMKKNSIFINVSRGNVVNQNDLYVALKTGLIAAAGLDVTTPEPLPITNELFQLKNCVITPHICSAEISTRLKMSNITAQNILNGLEKMDLVHEIKMN